MTDLGRWLIIACALLGVIVLYPSKLDLIVANWFFDPRSGAFIGSERAASLMQHGLMLACITFVSLCLAILALNFVLRWHSSPAVLGLHVPSRSVIFLLLALALGPGLVVNGVLKSNWGRARPRDVIEFAGTKQFTYAFVLSDQCKSNCSFVSGEASIGFYGLAFMFVFRRRRNAIAVASILCGAAIGAVRMSVGAHFLSDVVFSGVITFISAYLSHLLVFGSALGLRIIGRTSQPSGSIS